MPMILSYDGDKYRGSGKISIYQEPKQFRQGASLQVMMLFAVRGPKSNAQAVRVKTTGVKMRKCEVFQTNSMFN